MAATSVKKGAAPDFSSFANVIDGRLVTGVTTSFGLNPATEKPNPKVPIATLDDVNFAVEAAQRASKSWVKTTLAERAAAVNAFAAAITGNRDQFAGLLTQEQGKPLAEACGEVDAGSFWLTETAKLGLQDEIIEDSSDRRVTVRYTPLGVAVGIIPWNFPVQQTCGKIGPAVMTGNSIILKPSPFTPYCALKLGELAQQFFPPGVIQVLNGDDNLGPWLTTHRGINKISFTGSTATGRRIMQAVAGSFKRVTLEMGGNDAAIVCEDVDVGSVVKKVAGLAFTNAGQVCMAIKRIFVHAGIYEPFREALVNYMRSLKVGDGADPGVHVGPIQNMVQYKKVKSYIEEVQGQGLKSTAGDQELKPEGFFVNPMLVERPPDDARIVVEEPFGPIVPILTWEKEEEVIKRANNTTMGLGASVWSKDKVRGKRIAEQLEAGTVWINTHLEPSPTIPFGGFKDSAVGVEYSTAGMRAFCNLQAIVKKKSAEEM
ncbi:Aldehyde/histidinol dehydrogenase [Aspergillus pseudoustus]|uniref:aldehyde dehydrogenase (NAD(+)) n=1 Tax=Aspergillus pseudoustus TaxID=1810923 RepID=A0ABR4K9B0_9EURO